MARYQPDGWPTVTPRLITADVSGLVDFLKAVFGAEGELLGGAPTELRIGDFPSDGQRRCWRARGLACVPYVYVPDADEAYRRALALEALSIEAPADMPYGDRRAMVRDRWGNTWQIATRTPA